MLSVNHVALINLKNDFSLPRVAQYATATLCYEYATLRGFIICRIYAVLMVATHMPQ
jgi:hypothetical protein